MDHKADIRFVDPHSKRVCRHHDLGAIEDKIFLILLSLAVGKSRMVSRHGESVLHQLLRHFLHEFSRQAVDDAALSCMFFDIRFYRRIFIFRALNLKVEIRAVKSRRRHDRILQL